MSGWAQRDAEEREQRENEIERLDAMLNAAQEAAGVDTYDNLLAWIRAKQRRVAKHTADGFEWTDSEHASTLEEWAVFAMKGLHGCQQNMEAVYKAAGIRTNIEDLLAWICERRGNDWQPIATAPKDGTPVDLWAGGRRACDFAWDPGVVMSGTMGGWRHLSAVITRDVTHWRPIPEGPKAE